MKLDKILHIMAGMAMALVVGGPCWMMCYDLQATLWAAVLSGVIAGAVKEFCDLVYQKTWDWRDFGATCLGVAVAAVILAVVGLCHVERLSTRTLNNALYHTSPAFAGESIFTIQQSAVCRSGIRLVNPQSYETAY